LRILGGSGLFGGTKAPGGASGRHSRLAIAKESQRAKPFSSLEDEALVALEVRADRLEWRLATFRHKRSLYAYEKEVLIANHPAPSIGKEQILTRELQPLVDGKALLRFWNVLRSWTR
jgi:hypothetical protein